MYADLLLILFPTSKTILYENYFDRCSLTTTIRVLYPPYRHPYYSNSRLTLRSPSQVLRLELSRANVFSFSLPKDGGLPWHDAGISNTPTLD